VSLQLARWLLRRRKRGLERRIVRLDRWDGRLSRQLDAVTAALEALS
jgi:hypothetical protein